MSELAEPHESSVAEPATCPECLSLNVRLSQSSYPRDSETNSAEQGSFWRCRNCGGRFLGPPGTPETKRQRHRRHGSRNPLSLRGRAARAVNRWTFPVIVVLTVIMLVIVFIDYVNAPARPRLGFPD